MLCSVFLFKLLYIISLNRLNKLTGKNITECMESSETQYFWFRTTLASSDSIGMFKLIVFLVD